MSDTLLTKYRDQRAELASEIEAAMSGDTFDPADKTFVEARSRAEDLDAKIKTITEWQQSRASANAVDAVAVRTSAAREELEVRETRPATIGDAWVRSSAYANYMNTPKGTSAPVSVSWDTVMQTRAVITTGTFAGLLQPDRIAPSSPPMAQTPLLDNMSQIRVNSNSVEWIFYPAQAPLGTVTAEGSPKTEGAIAPVLQTVTLNTVASWAQYSRQFGEDGPGLVDFLNEALGRGINDKREALAAAELVGDTSIPDIPNTGGTLLQGIRRAIAGVQDAGYMPSVVVLNPQDYADIDIELLGKIVMGVGTGPQQGAQFWGVTPIPVGAIPVGTAFVGDLRTAMAELVRSDVSVYTTDSDIIGAGASAASAFRSNVLTTLVEARTAPIVHRAEAMAKVTADNP